MHFMHLEPAIVLKIVNYLADYLATDNIANGVPQVAPEILLTEVYGAYLLLAI
jgi:hypothetical protein